MRSFPFHAQASGIIDAPVEAVFEFLDDQANLSAHMSKPSAMMLGSAMAIQMEADHTRNVGSKFGFTGQIFGIPLAVYEVVTARNPPFSKTWQTTEEPCLWVIGPYQMAFELTPEVAWSNMRVTIDYDVPASGFSHLLGQLFGRFYAQWCTKKMVIDAGNHFKASISSHSA